MYYLEMMLVSIPKSKIQQSFQKHLRVQGKIAEKAVRRSDSMALYFECRINENALLQPFFVDVRN